MSSQAPATLSARSRRTARTGADLAAAQVVPPGKVAEIDKVAARYAVAVTPTLLDLIDPADPADPIARQFIPDARELDAHPGELTDPIGDDSHSPVKGIVHRYPDRVLLTPILHCPLYCRFCFRREKVGGEEAVLSDADLDAAFAYIRDHEEVWEVVITGGDPLMLPATKLKALMQRLDAIPHVATVRFHSRVPVGDPGRIGPALIDALTSERLSVWLAVHCNHPRELSSQTQDALRRLNKAGIPLLGQTVLLAGVNDDPQVMEELLRALVKNRVKPYYLHHTDMAPGTAHFRLSITQGQDLMRQMRGNLSGLCQPTYVLDIPGGHGKAPIGPVWKDGDQVTDWQGNRHTYKG